MFKSIKMNLKNKLNDSEEVNKIRWKINKFLELNPDVDHYWSDEQSKRSAANFVVGLLYGIGLGAILIGAFALYYLNLWKALGYLHLPGW